MFFSRYIIKQIELITCAAAQVNHNRRQEKIHTKLLVTSIQTIKLLPGLHDVPFFSRVAQRKKKQSFCSCHFSPKKSVIQASERIEKLRELTINPKDLKSFPFSSNINHSSRNEHCFKIVIKMCYIKQILLNRYGLSKFYSEYSYND